MFFLRCPLMVFLTFLASLMPAHAHLGHVGEVVGHAHWLGLGAVIVAGVLTALLGKLKQSESEEEDELQEETETEGASA